MSPHIFPGTYSIDTKCHKCGHKFELTIAASGDLQRPVSGSISVCVGCSEIGIFDSNLAVRAITEEEWLALPDGIARRIETTSQAIKNVLQRRQMSMTKEEVDALFEQRYRQA